MSTRRASAPAERSITAATKIAAVAVKAVRTEVNKTRSTKRSSYDTANSFEVPQGSNQPVTVRAYSWRDMVADEVTPVIEWEIQNYATGTKVTHKSYGTDDIDNVVAIVNALVHLVRA